MYFRFNAQTSSSSSHQQLLSSADEQSKVIVVMPLVALAQQQQKVMCDAGIKAVYAAERQHLLPALTDAATTHVLLSPELLQHSLVDTIQQVPASTRKTITHIMVDESHCVVKW